MAIVFCLVLIVLALRFSQSMTSMWIVLTALLPSWWTVASPIGSLNIGQGLGLAIAIALVSHYLVKNLKLAWRKTLWALPLVLFAGLSITGRTSVADVSAAITLWIVPAIMGMFAVASNRRTLAIMGVLVGGWALLEYLFHWHVFENLQPESLVWSPIQTRGSYDRSEASFGHSIALGGFLALSLPSVITYFRPRVAIAGSTLILAGLATTFSRGAFIATLVTLAAYSIFTSGRRRISFGLLVVAVAITSTVYQSLTSSVTTNLGGSTNYRQEAIRGTIGSLEAIGTSRSVYINPVSGLRAFNGFISVDNSLLLIALIYGWVLALFLFLVVLYCSFRGLLRVKSPLSSALLGQIAMLFSVAPITQWQIFLFFLIGLVVGDIRQATHPLAELQPHKRRQVSEENPIHVSIGKLL